MSARRRGARTDSGRARILAAIIALQAGCAAFFVADVIVDLGAAETDRPFHLVLESLAALSLIGGVVYLAVELRRLLSRMGDMDAGLQVARGRMAELMESFFEDWSLTGAERDVAMMLLKGLDNDAIARLRGTASGTVRAQTARIYAKSGTSGRTELLSLFMEELVAGGPGAAGPPALPSGRSAGAVTARRAEAP